MAAMVDKYFANYLVKLKVAHFPSKLALDQFVLIFHNFNKFKIFNLKILPQVFETKTAFPKGNVLSF